MAATERDQLRDVLIQLRRRVDDHFAAAAERSPRDLTCAAGCAACCHQRIGVFEVEAAVLREALAVLAQRDPDRRARVRRQADDPAAQHHCALLLDGRCAVYAARPLICRSHGLPIAVEGDAPAPRVDHCPLNYQEAAPPPASVLRLAAVNQPLAVLAALWASDAPSAPIRVELAELARAADPPPSLSC
jgi:Fe-S-cluster containining protein